MSERKRLVHGKQFDYFVCDVHDWEFDESTIDDVCPVCRGEQMERERIIKLLEIEIGELEGHEGSCDCKTRADELRVTIALVEGEEQ